MLYCCMHEPRLFRRCQLTENHIMAPQREPGCYLPFFLGGAWRCVLSMRIEITHKTTEKRSSFFYLKNRWIWIYNHTSRLSHKTIGLLPFQIGNFATWPGKSNEASWFTIPFAPVCKWYSMQRCRFHSLEFFFYVSGYLMSQLREDGLLGLYLDITNDLIYINITEFTPKKTKTQGSARWPHPHSNMFCQTKNILSMTLLKLNFRFNN